MKKLGIGKLFPALSASK